MTKEIYISSTPHETRLAVVEDDQLAEIYYERENEYTLAGSVYKGKVTRVLPGMQSAFVDIGLERDAFLYVTDFAEEQEDGDDYVSLTPGQQPRNAQSAADSDAPAPRATQSGSRLRPAAAIENQPAAAPAPRDAAHDSGDRENGESGRGTRRWRGRRGRRRGRGAGAPAPSASTEPGFASEPQEIDLDEQSTGEPEDFSAGQPIHEHAVREHPLQAHPLPSVADDSSPTPRPEHGRGDAGRASSRPAPVMLPGESLSKYRRSGAQDVAVETAASSATSSAHSAPASSASSRPSTIVENLPGWDGGGLLPGESLSRYKKQPASTPAQPPAPAPHAELPHASASSSLQAEIAAPQPELATDDAIPQAAALPQDAGDEQPHSAAPEFEPSEASASYRVDPAAPSTYRQSSVSEAPAVADASFPDAPDVIPTPLAAEYPEPAAIHEAVPETAPLSTPDAHAAAAQPAMEQPATEQPAMEQPESAPEPFFGEAVSIAPHVPPPAAKHAPAMRNFEAVEETSETEEAAETEEATWTGSEAETEEDLDGGPFHPGQPGQVSHAFDPGQGLLEEEMIDEEEADPYSVSSLLEESEYDELVEETLDVQMDSGLLSELVRDQHIDLRTRFVEEPGVSDDGLEEDDETGPEIGEIEIEEDFDSETASEPENGEPEHADARSGAAPSPGQRPGRRGNRAQRPGGDRRRMRRATAQTSSLPAITELLKPNQEILVQIAKEPIARKGARITSHIALPGRFLVFMPTVNHVGVSRKISSDEERQRLKRILLSEKGTAAGGFIVRTAAATASEEDLRADIRFLLNLWAEIRQRADSSKPPALIYHDLSLVERILRDQVTDHFSAIWVDSEADYERVLRFLNRFEPSLVRRVKLYTKETPLFEQFGIQEEINKALRSKVWLKSGGSIVINQTEALVAIDINTGKYVGKTARLEDTILKTNLDAIPEIVRQIRLRDLGGIIVIDFIDMDERKNRHKVMQALEEALRADRAPSKVLQFNDFGLVAITRKRVKQSLERTLSIPCSTCSGTGMVKAPLTVCNEIYIELRKMYLHIERGDILLRVHPEVVKQLKANNGRWLSEMEELTRKTIIVKSDPTLHPEQFDIH